MEMRGGWALCAARKGEAAKPRRERANHAECSFRRLATQRAALGAMEDDTVVSVLRDAATPALATSIAMLAIFSGALVLTMQHVAERYSAGLYPVLAWHEGGVGIVLLALPVVGSLVLIGLPDSRAAQVAALALIGLSVGVTGWRAYHVWTIAADPRQLVALTSRVPAARRQRTRLDMLAQSVVRGDVVVTGAVLDGAEATGDLAELLQWLLDHHGVTDRRWLLVEWLRQLRRCALNPGVDEVIYELVGRSLNQALDREDFFAGQAIVRSTFDILQDKSPWEEWTGALLTCTGLAIWRLGEGRGAPPRTAVHASDLEELKGMWGVRRRRLLSVLIGRADKDALSAFCDNVASCVGDVQSGGIFNLLWDMLGEEDPTRLPSIQAILDLAIYIDYLGYHPYDDDGTVADPGTIDSLIDSGVAALTRLQASEDDIERFIGNAGKYRRANRGGRD